MPGIKYDIGFLLCFIVDWASIEWDFYIFAADFDWSIFRIIQSPINLKNGIQL